MISRFRKIKGINYILLPVKFYDTALTKIMQDNPELKVECQVKWHDIKDRGVYLINNSKNEEEICYPIHQSELNWIKKKYEMIF